MQVNIPYIDPMGNMNIEANMNSQIENRLNMPANSAIDAFLWFTKIGEETSYHR